MFCGAATVTRSVINKRVFMPLPSSIRGPPSYAAPTRCTDHELQSHRSWSVRYSLSLGHPAADIVGTVDKLNPPGLRAHEEAHCTLIDQRHIRQIQDDRPEAHAKEHFELDDMLMVDFSAQSEDSRIGARRPLDSAIHKHAP